MGGFRKLNKSRPFRSQEKSDLSTLPGVMQATLPATAGAGAGAAVSGRYERQDRRTGRPQAVV